MTPQQSYPSYESNNNNNVGELTGYQAPRSVPIMSHKNQTTPKNCQTTPEPETLPDLLSSSILPPSAPMEPYDMRPKPTPMQQPAPAERPHGTCTTQQQQQQPTIVGANVQFRSALDRPPKENTANTPAAHDPTPTTIAPPTDPTALILQAYDHHPESVTATTISDSHSSSTSSSTVLLSMYKTDAPPKPNTKKFDTDECDRVVYQATEAALYAEELIQQQQQTRGWFSLRKQRRHNDTPRQRHDDDHPKKDVNEHKTNKDKLRDTAASKIRSTPNHKPQFSMTKHATSTTEPPPKQKNSDTYKTAVPAWSAMTQQQQQKQTPDDTTVPRWATQPRPNRNHNDPPDQTTASSVVGASLLGAVAGTMVLGPVGAVAAASGAAYAALNKKSGTVGSMVRGAGSVVAKVGGTAVSKGAAVVVGGQQRRKPSSKHNNNSDKNKGFQSYNPP